MSPTAQIVHLYRYPHPTEPGRFLYVGQGADRDRVHRGGTTSFGRRFKQDFPGVALPQPVRWTEPATTDKERNAAEERAIVLYHTWDYEGGYNVVTPGTEWFLKLSHEQLTRGRANGGETRGPVLGKEYGPINGRISGPITGKIAGAKAVASGQIQQLGLVYGKINGSRTVKIMNCVRWHIRRGKPCICGHHAV
jgi:hypothetical protein